MQLNDDNTIIRQLGSTYIKENVAAVNLRHTLRAAGIFAALFCFWMQPAAAQQEIKLTKSITMLPDRPAADCSFVQTMVFRVPSQRGPRLVVGTAKRAPRPEVEDIPSQADPVPQRIRIYVPKNSEDDPGKSPIWLDAIGETVTQKALCSVEDVRKAIQLFLRQHIAELASQ